MGKSSERKVSSNLGLAESGFEQLGPELCALLFAKSVYHVDS